MKPVLVILAAGRSKRFGRLKQIEPLGANGETMIDYTLFDAIRAGFNKAVVVTSKQIAPVLKTRFSRERLKNKIDIGFVIQEVPQNRTKPWGTGQAVLIACKNIKQPLVVVNGDDFYGFAVLKTICQALSSADARSTISYLIGYLLGNTLSEHGENSRGICRVDTEGFLSTIVEQTNIFKTSQGIFRRDGNNRLHALSAQTVVSMNCWGFPARFNTLLEPLYMDFISKHHNDSEIEFFLPDAINKLIVMKKMQVKVLVTEHEWFGITFEEDSRQVKNNLKRLIAHRVYPNTLW
jgi:GTP:adenosylcobinamide-phosphate guanylyltransferase